MAAATQPGVVAEVAVKELETLVHRIVERSLGYASAEEAATITRILLYAQVRGNSQGVIKVSGCVTCVHVHLPASLVRSLSLVPSLHACMHARNRC